MPATPLGIIEELKRIGFNIGERPQVGTPPELPILNANHYPSRKPVNRALEELMAEQTNLPERGDPQFNNSLIQRILAAATGFSGGFATGDPGYGSQLSQNLLDRTSGYESAVANRENNLIRLQTLLKAAEGDYSAGVQRFRDTDILNKGLGEDYDRQMRNYQNQVDTQLAYDKNLNSLIDTHLDNRRGDRQTDISQGNLNLGRDRLNQDASQHKDRMGISEKQLGIQEGYYGLAQDNYDRTSTQNKIDNLFRLMAMGGSGGGTPKDAVMNPDTIQSIADQERLRGNVVQEILRRARAVDEAQGTEISRGWEVDPDTNQLISYRGFNENLSLGKGTSDEQSLYDNLRQAIIAGRAGVDTGTMRPNYQATFPGGTVPFTQYSPTGEVGSVGSAGSGGTQGGTQDETVLNMLRNLIGVPGGEYEHTPIEQKVPQGVPSFTGPQQEPSVKAQAPASSIINQLLEFSTPQLPPPNDSLGQVMRGPMSGPVGPQNQIDLSSNPTTVLDYIRLFPEAFGTPATSMEDFMILNPEIFRPGGLGGVSYR